MMIEILGIKVSQAGCIIALVYWPAVALSIMYVGTLLRCFCPRIARLVSIRKSRRNHV